MRIVSSTVVTMIFAIALYFTCSWGLDALRILTSPTYGLEDVWGSQFIFGIGRLFDAGPDALLRTAAMFGAIKLIVASIFGLHVLDRLRSLISGKADLEILEAALILAIIACLVAAAPALWTHNGDIARDQTVPLLLAALAAALCIVERATTPGADPRVLTPREEGGYLPGRH